MRLYADLPARRTRQVVADVLVLAWVVAFALAGRAVHDTVLRLQGPADRLTSAGSSFGSSMQGAAEQLGRLPGVGDALRRPFDSAAGSGAELTRAGQDLADAAGHLALVLGLVVALVPVSIVVLPWLLLRLRWVHRAAAVGRVAAGDLDLVALRALAHQPVRRLAALGPAPARAWREGDPVAVRRLAELELTSLGLRPPWTRPAPPE
ncbi:hypothetical protein [Lapillicoccus jejuensis]|uniref:Transmembrane protein n=1 Tax=Lapillicoccus jejuensis TaxID=402171 RepID=A0A542E534_9MICO|nr:hypothetical protein [Lapillicoccus jejuensis]TQJ10451.1 hypothetical protein FB458_3574 [Lapillicoccus jejuensis]